MGFCGIHQFHKKCSIRKMSLENTLVKLLPRDSKANELRNNGLVSSLGFGYTHYVMQLFNHG